MFDPVLQKHIFSVHVNNIEVYIVVNEAPQRFRTLGSTLSNFESDQIRKEFRTLLAI